MKNRHDEQNQDRDRQPDARRERNDQHKSSQAPGSPGTERRPSREFDMPHGSVNVGGSPGKMKVPTGETGGSGVVRGDSGIQSGSGLDTSGAAGVPGAGLSEEATTRSEERDTGSSPGSTDFSHIAEMGDTGMEGPVGGTAGITDYMGKSGVVGRLPDIEGTAGVADRGEINPKEPSGGTPGVRGHTPSGRVARGSEPSHSERKHRKDDPEDKS